MTKCTNKGRCCREIPNGVYAKLGIKGDEVIMIVRDNTCNHLDTETGDCTIYNKRPIDCATYPCNYCNYGADDTEELIQLIC